MTGNPPEPEREPEREPDPARQPSEHIATTSGDPARASAGASAPDRVLDLYDSALPLVYGYLLPRCGGIALAEDLTAETFLAAVDEARRGDPARMSVPWIIGVARHKLMDHWRRQYRDERRRQALADDGAPAVADAWDEKLDAVRAHEVLQ
ncbi:MAG TPA: sigma-70 family RNA polymerase sigma factor, partial [Acidimicrobiales bacterium]